MPPCDLYMYIDGLLRAFFPSDCPANPGVSLIHVKHESNGC